MYEKFAKLLIYQQKIINVRITFNTYSSVMRNMTVHVWNSFFVNRKQLDLKVMKPFKC